MNWLNSQLILGPLMILFSVVFHVFGLVFLARSLSWVSPHIASWKPIWSTIGLLVLGLIPIIALHISGALAWALLYVHLEEFGDLTQALYFSVATSTTLGYGDLTLSPKWQLLSTFEAIAGLLLFGASTAFLLALMNDLFKDIGAKND